MITEIVGFLAGSIVTGLMTYLNSTWLDDLKTRREVDAVLVAINAEIKMLKAFYQKAVGERLERCKKENEPFCKRKFVHRANYFIVYPGNTSVVGKLEDPLLAEAIIGTYGTGKNLIEVCEENTRLLDEWVELIREEKRGNDQTAQERRKFQEDILCHVFRQLQHDYGEFLQAASNLLERITSYRATHPVSRIPQPFRTFFDRYDHWNP